MLFNSYIFIFIFLPVTLIVWFSLNKIKQYKLAEVFLIGMSLWFYAYFNFSYLFIIVGSCLFNFLISYFINRIEKKQFEINYDFNNKSNISANEELVKNSRNSNNTILITSNGNNTSNRKNSRIKIIGIIGIIVNLGILFYYKYFDFFIENINFIFQKDYNLKHILLPLGISFFTFQQLSYVVDRMKGTAPHYEIIDYMSFVTFFPQLIAGPIVLHSELIPQFKDMEKRRFNVDNFTDGCVQAILGLGKKVLLADTLALVVNSAYDNRYYFTTWSAILFILTYAFELYFDFSGYCDIAMGIGKMFNYEIPRNFNYPYHSTSMKEFWNRWHITLGRFFVTYVYIPLGGSRKGTKRKIMNYMAVFLLSGLWHGSSWNYVMWGFLNGLGVIFNNLRANTSQTKVTKLQYEDDCTHKKFENLNFCDLKHFMSWLCTFGYFLFTLFFFRCETMNDVGIVLKGLINPVGVKFVVDMAQYMDIPELYIFKRALEMFAPQLIRGLYLAAYILIMVICTLLLRGKNAEDIVKEGNYTTGKAIGLSIILIWSIISLSGVSTFLYFNF